MFILFVFVLQDPNLLEGRVTLRQVKAGSVVANQGDQVCNDIQPKRLSAIRHYGSTVSFSSVLLYICLELCILHFLV